MEIGFVVKLIVQLHVSTKDLQSVKLLNTTGGLSVKFMRKGFKVSGNWDHMKVNMVYCEPENFR